MQSDTGATDFILYANYLAAYKNLELNRICGYRLNSENKYGERASNGFTTNLSLFYEIALSAKWAIIPSFQNYFERSKGI